MKKVLLVSSALSVVAVAAALVVSTNARGIILNRVKADSVVATVTYDKDHHAQNPTDYGGTMAKYKYDALSTSGGYVHSWIQLESTSSEKWDGAPSDAYFSYTSSGASQKLFLRMEVAGASEFSWLISYTGLDSDYQGRIQLISRDEGWGFVSMIHSSSLFNNGEHTIDVSSLSEPYHLELLIYNIPKDATIKLETLSISYSVENCKAA